MKPLGKINNIILYITILSTCFFVMRDWTPLSFFVVGVLILNIFPHLLLLWINKKKPQGSVLSLIFTIIISGQAIFNYVNALYIHPDAQGGLVFLFLPIYLLIQILIYYVCKWLFEKVVKRKDPQSFN